MRTPPRRGELLSGSTLARLRLLIGCLAALFAGSAAVCPLNARAAATDYGGIEPAVCAGCAPPLDYSGGPVMAEHSPDGLVVVPIYWVPQGGRYAFGGGFERTVTRFVGDVAAASGKTDNVFSVATEYYGERFSVRVPVRYALRAVPAVIDRDAFPRSGCTPVHGYTACITDAQLRDELVRFTRGRGLAADLDHVYAVFFPPGVETTNVDGTNSVDDFCGYHYAFDSGGKQVIYTNQPYEVDGCGAGQAPNGNLAADTVIGVLSHELIEVMTDPLNQPRAWDDKSGYEIADLCADTYGRPLGSTVSSDRDGTEYNQVINGDRYYLPEEFSNFAYERFGPDRGCVLSEHAAHASAAAATGRVSAQTFTIDATPTALAADGKAKAEIVVTSSDTAGNGLAGDHIHFDVDDASGSSACGTLSARDVTTNADGQASVTYTASKQDVSCWVSAVDAEGGRSAQALIRQGTAAAAAQSIVAAFPRALQAGGSPVLFTLKATNPSTDAMAGMLMHFVVFPAGARAHRVAAAQIRLSYSAKGTSGPFVPVPLVGSTGNGNVIQGYIGPLRGTNLQAFASQTLTLRVTVAADVAVSKSAPLVFFQTFLDQTDTASGSDVTLADTGRAAVTVPTAVVSHTARNVALAVAAALALLAGLGLMISRRRRSPSRG